MLEIFTVVLGFACVSDYSALALGALTVRVAVDVWRNLPGL